MEGQRRHLSRLLVAEQNRSALLSDPSLRLLNKRLIAQVKKQIAALDLRLKQLIEESEELCRKARQLTAVAGVGPRTAALLLAQMPELGELNRREAAALAGHARQTHHLWRPSRCAQRALHGRFSGHSPQPRPGCLLPKTARCR